MIEPIACVTHAVFENARINPGDIVLVSGPGAIGLSAMQLVRKQGAEVIVSGSSGDNLRLKQARELGAEYICNVSEDNLFECIKDITNGSGVDVTLECLGSPLAVDDSFRVLKKLGQHVQIGLLGKNFSIDFEGLCYKEIKISGSIGSQRSSWEKAFRMFEGKEGLKILLDPSDHKGENQ